MSFRQELIHDQAALEVIRRIIEHSGREAAGGVIMGIQVMRFAPQYAERLIAAFEALMPLVDLVPEQGEVIARSSVDDLRLWFAEAEAEQ